MSQTANENAPLAGTGEALGNAVDKVDFISDILRQQSLSEAEHLGVMPCFDGARAESSGVLDIRQMFFNKSVAANPDRARPKLDGRAIVLAVVEAESITRKGFKPSALAMLAADFDGGNLSATDIHVAVAGFFGHQAIWCVFSTASSLPDNRRWRLFIPLAQPVAPDVWLRTQRGFATCLKGRGVTVDTTADRATQLHFLPNVPWSITDKQGREVATRKRDERNAQRQQALANGGDGMTPMERFNLDHSAGALMLTYGYTEDPHKPGY